jgi:hypothetical protein
VPTARAERWIIEAKPNACRYFATGGDRHEQVAAGNIVALRYGAGGMISGVTCVIVARCTSHIVTAVIR